MEDLKSASGTYYAHVPRSKSNWAQDVMPYTRDFMFTLLAHNLFQHNLSSERNMRAAVDIRA